eukprot:TRINITY_DN6223_c1_g1_i1.p1 TRINITY_DN6223_c1_g1~~TRINITY_DN6223_c1_g1_i1.p1  ORF type:complete len:371 (+),score=65.55 TRINITY_DN6223_c1_g1_i1:58-1170(+)
MNPARVVGDRALAQMMEKRFRNVINARQKNGLRAMGFKERTRTAQEVMRQLRKWETDGEDVGRRTYSFSLMLNAILGTPMEAELCLSKLKKKHVPSLQSYEQLSKCYANNGNIKGVLGVTARLVADGYQQTSAMYQSAISAFSRLTCEREAFDVFRVMIREGVPVTEGVCFALIDACTTASRALSVFDRLQTDRRFKIVPTLRFYNHIFLVFLKELSNAPADRMDSHYNDAINFEKTIPFEKNLVTHNVGIKLEAIMGDIARVLVRYKAMKDAGHEPSIVTYGSILRCISNKAKLTGQKPTAEEIKLAEFTFKQASFIMNPNMTVVTQLRMAEIYSYVGETEKIREFISGRRECHPAFHTYIEASENAAK